jgi:hypothetical protein
VTHACARFSDNSYDENEEGRTWILEDDGSQAASTMQARIFLNPANQTALEQNMDSSSTARFSCTLITFW